MKRQTTALVSTAIIVLCLSVSFKEENPGKFLFQANCAPCHAKNKELIGPAFQYIRKDYGLNWAVSFIKDGKAMVEKRDSRALYSFYKYQEITHAKFPTLTKSQIIQILNYVDDNTGSTSPIDTVQYRHRKLSETERQQFIKAYEAEKKKAESESVLDL